MLALPFFVAVGRALPESRRFTRPHGKATLEGHRGRLLMLCCTAFLGLMFFAPNTQFQNDFLRDEHGFSAVQITLFTFSTNTPGGLGIIIGGKLADVRGRRVIGAIGTVLGSILLAASFSLGMPWLWITSMFGTMAAGIEPESTGHKGDLMLFFPKLRIDLLRRTKLPGQDWKTYAQIDVVIRHHVTPLIDRPRFERREFLFGWDKNPRIEVEARYVGDDKPEKSDSVIAPAPINEHCTAT